MPVGKSGKHYFNPKVMEHHGDMPEEGHGKVHHIEIHPHGPSSEHPHHAEAHHYDGNIEHLGEHANYDEAAQAGKDRIDGDNDMQDEQMEGEEPEENAGTVRRADSGAY